jgi:acetyl esterase/lipase
MPLDPDAETLLAMMRAAGRPPMETLTPDEARAGFAAGRAATQPDPQDVADVRDLSCPGPHGPIPLRAYRPLGTDANEVLPALVYFHGAAGCWAISIPTTWLVGTTPMLRSAAWSQSIIAWRRNTSSPRRSTTQPRRPDG